MIRRPLAFQSVRCSGLVAACLLGWATIAPSGGAAEPGGGGDSGASVIRAELMREWDLDGDGKISKPEADVARARMKRERLEMQLGVGTDPITGLPGGLEEQLPADADAPEDPPLFRLPPELPPVRPVKPSTGPASLAPPPLKLPATPGSRSTRGGDAAAADTGRAASRSVSSRASWLPPSPRGSALTGGVRAGAPAAVPGYGAGPYGDLNAGRQRFAPQPQQQQQTAAGQPAAGSGGLLPQRRPIGRTGAILLPQVNGGQPLLDPAGPPAARPTPPPQPLLPRPRITAEEIGGYRP